MKKFHLISNKNRAWFRLKYPNIVDGGIAASAPILQFQGTGVSQWVFNEVSSIDMDILIHFQRL
jgi:hypothetical protein